VAENLAGRVGSEPGHTSDEGKTPSHRLIAILAVAVTVALFLLGWLEVRSSPPAPLALTVAVMCAFAVLCVIRLEAAFLSLLVLTPFSVQFIVPGTGSALQIPTEPMLFLALGVWLLRSLARGHHTVAQPALIGGLCLGLLSCILSIVDTEFRFNAVKATLNATWYGLYGVFLINNLSSRTSMLALIHAWVWPALAIVGFSAWNVMTGNYNRWGGYYFAEPFFYDHGTFSAYLSFICALSLALSLELTGLPRAAFIVLAGITGGQVIVSMTRGAWLGLAALLPFLVISYGRRILRPGNIGLIAVAACLVTVLIILTGSERDIEKHSGTLTQVGYQSNFERLNRWYAGYQMFRSDPINGIGYGTYQDYYFNFRRQALSTDQSRQRMGVHNEYLRVLAETGIVGALAATLSLFILTRVAWRAIRRTTDPLIRGVAVGMSGGLVTYLIHAMVNNYIEFDKAAIPVWTAIGALGAIERRQRRRD